MTTNMTTNKKIHDHNNTRPNTLVENLRHAPPGGWWRATWMLAVGLIIGIAFLYLVWKLAQPLGLFLIGVTLAAALAPIVGRLSNHMPRLVSVVVVYLVLLAIIGALIWLTFPRISSELQQAGDQLPQAVENLEQRLNGVPGLQNISLTDQLSQWFSGSGSGFLSVPMSIVSALFDVALVIFVSIYAILLAPGIRRFVLSLVPREAADNVDHVLTRMLQAMGGYVRGAVVDGILFGVMAYVGLLVIGVPFALVLAVVSAVLEAIPIIGTLITSALILGAALTVSPSTALITLVFVIVLQIVEGNILVPNVMHKMTSMSPILALFAVVAGGAVGGALGVLVAIPLAAGAHVLVVEGIAPAMRRWTGAEPVAHHASTD